MTDPKWEAGPWRLVTNGEDKGDSPAFFTAWVEGAKKRVVLSTVTKSGNVMSEEVVEQPAVVASLGIPYAGLWSSTIRANGNLIAAADDLFHAMRALLGELRIHMDFWQRGVYVLDPLKLEAAITAGEAAVAKALGE